MAWYGEGGQCGVGWVDTGCLTPVMKNHKHRGVFVIIDVLRLSYKKMQEPRVCQNEGMTSVKGPLKATPLP